MCAISQMESNRLGESNPGFDRILGFGDQDTCPDTIGSPPQCRSVLAMKATPFFWLKGSSVSISFVWGRDAWERRGECENYFHMRKEEKMSFYLPFFHSFLKEEFFSQATQAQQGSRPSNFSMSTRAHASVHIPLSADKVCSFQKKKTNLCFFLFLFFFFFLFFSLFFFRSGTLSVTLVSPAH